MSGNVAEWVEGDYESPHNGSANSSLAAIKGGDAFSIASVPSFQKSTLLFRPGNRASSNKESLKQNIGFRIAK